MGVPGFWPPTPLAMAPQPEAKPPSNSTTACVESASIPASSKASASILRKTGSSSKPHRTWVPELLATELVAHALVRNLSSQAGASLSSRRTQKRLLPNSTYKSVRNQGTIARRTAKARTHTSKLQGMSIQNTCRLHQCWVSLFNRPAAALSVGAPRVEDPWVLATDPARSPHTCCLHKCWVDLFSRPAAALFVGAPRVGHPWVGGSAHAAAHTASRQRRPESCRSRA